MCAKHGEQSDLGPFSKGAKGRIVSHSKAGGDVAKHGEAPLRSSKSDTDFYSLLLPSCARQDRVVSKDKEQTNMIQIGKAAKRWSESITAACRIVDDMLPGNTVI